MKIIVNKSPLTVDIKDSLGVQVKRLRTECGMTQQVLAGRCNIFRTYLSRIESGDANPAISVLAALAVNLNVTIFELFQE